MLKAVHISNLIIICLSTWAIYISASAFWGITVYFPFIVSDEANIPFHRMQIVRISVLLTFAYFGIMHLIKGSDPLYPIQFLSVYLKFLVIAGLPICFIHGVPFLEYSIWLFFFICSVILHIASKPKYRKYFSTKK